MMRAGWFADRRRLLITTLLVWLLAFGILSASAQAETPTPLTIGEIQVGELTQPGASLTFVVLVPTAQTLDIDIFEITAGLTPSFRLTNSGGTVLHIALNDGSQASAQARAISVSAGVYFIEVTSQTSTTGQFLISAQFGAPVTPPQPLNVGQVLDGQTSTTQPLERYAFSSQPVEPLLLTVYSMDTAPALLVTLKDASTTETLATSSARISGLSYRLVPGEDDYLLEISSDSPRTPQNYIVCLELESDQSVCPIAAQAQTVPPTVVPATPSPVPTVFVPATLSPLGPCVVASSTGGRVNIRSGPSTSFSVIGQITGNTTAPVIGRLPDNTWYQISPAGLIGWISASVIRLGGQCGAVPSVTLTPQPTMVVTPSATSFGPTSTPSSTPTATLTPPVQPTLNFSLPPNYGSQALAAGFVPDPFTVNITSGGPVNVSYLGGGCTGWATSAPDFSLNYTAGAFPLLRFYFIGGGDTTMIINTPGGSYVCVDDSFGTLNPTIDFNSPASGRYDIWIGSFSEGASISGTLHVTENNGNHP